MLFNECSKSTFPFLNLIDLSYCKISHEFEDRDGTIQGKGGQTWRFPGVTLSLPTLSPSTAPGQVLLHNLSGQLYPNPAVLGGAWGKGLVLRHCYSPKYLWK